MSPVLLNILVLTAPALAQDTAASALDGLAGGEAIVVTGERGEAPAPGQTSASVTVIQVDERLPASADVAEVVDSASGTTVQRLGGLGDWSGVSIRGANIRHTQVFLDGVPLNPDGATSVNLSELPLMAFDRVELYRGNAPPEFAAAPIGGVVNLATGDRSDPAHAAAVTWGSLRTGRLSAFSAIPGERSHTFLAAEAFSTQGDYPYFADNGTEYNLLDDHVLERSNNDKRQLSAHGRWRTGERLRLTLLESFLARDEGLPGHTNNPTSGTRLATTRSLSVADLETGGGAWRLRGRTWGLVRQEALEDPLNELGIGQTTSSNRFTHLGAMAHFSAATAPRIAPAVTASARREGYGSYDADDQRLLELSRRAVTGAVSADIRLLQERITLSPVAQLLWLDSRDLEHSQPEFVEGVDARALTHLNPRLGLLVLPVERVALKANVGHYLRPPDLTELFGDRGALVGNPELVPERGLQWDIGGRWLLPPDWAVAGSLDLAHFWNRTQDLVTYIQNSQRTLVPINLDEAWVQGLELAASLTWLDLVETQTNLTRNVSVNLSTDPAYANNQLPRIPTLEIYQRTAIYRDARVSTRLGHTYSYTDGNYWDRTNWYLSTPRPLHGVFARIQPGEDAPSIELDVLNLFDRTVEVVPRNPLDPQDDANVVQPITDFVGYPLPGRTFMVTVRWEGRPTQGDRQ